MKIVIVDYGSGNLRSVQKGFEKTGHLATITNNPNDILDATHVVLPGVGAFSTCMKNLEVLHLLGPIKKAITDGKPYLGICLGLQILFTEGEEFGSFPGLNIIPGKVVRFPKTVRKVPHIGWNQIHIENKSDVLGGIAENSYFYFVHSYYGVPEKQDCVATTTQYDGVTFASAITKDNIFACQFHPEKSQAKGLALLSNFAKQR
ncbi:MAG: imidazole glycerol phosphate synthase subunit HisH [Nitrospirota bacterium]